MSEKPLLLPSAKTGVLVLTQNRRDYMRWFFVVAGMFVVFYGLVNILSRLDNYMGAGAAQTAFMPLGAWPAQQPSDSTNVSQPGSASASFASTIATTTPIIPVRLKIASIGVDATVEQVGKKVDGSMATPSSFETTGWYKLGARPGEPGNAVIDGHVNNALTKSGVFEHLSNVNIGDYITVTDASGTTLTYVVFETDQYTTANAPAAEIFTSSGPSQLVLITCDGQWDAAAHSYDKRFVVYARLTSR